MLTFLEYIQERALEEGNPLARVKKHEDEGRASAGITGWRAGLPHHENKARMKAFDKDLKDLGYGYRKTKGKWEGGSEESRYVTAKGTDKKSTQKFRGDMENLSKKYNQDAVALRSKRKTVLKGTNDTGEFPGKGRVASVGKTRYNKKDAEFSTEFKPSKPEASRPKFSTGKGIDHENPNRSPGNKPKLP